MNITFIEAVRRVFRYLRPYRLLAVTSITLMILGACAALLAPWPLKIVVDHVLQDHPVPAWLSAALGAIAQTPTSLLLAAVLAAVVVAVLMNGLDVLSNYINTKIQQLIVLDVRSDLFAHAQRLSLAFHDRRRSGKVIYLINNQGDAPASLIMTVPMLGQSLLTLAGMFVVAYRMDWVLALVSMAVVPFLYYSVSYYAKHIESRLQHVRRMEGESLSVVHESISMIRVIVAFGREDHEHRRFHDQTARAVNARVNLTVRQSIFSFAVNMITAIGSALVLGLGAYQVMQGKLTVGQLLVVIAYIAAVYKPLQTISYTVGSLQERLVSLKAAFKLLDTIPTIKDEPGAKTIERSRGQVVYERVHFSYAHRTETLKDISFEARPGQVIGIVGQTGAGKSTLISLLPRFYEPQEGRILLDGTDVRQLTVRSLREQISLVLQEPLLFSDTIAENIRYGRLDASDDEIMAAAQAANAHDFIMRLPQKYQTMVGERGAAISGGERQRISVARAFLKNAPILILDEPTSSVDSKTEAVILDALDRLMVGRTTFMIAHRLSTLHQADLILVMNNGQLVEQGKPEELLEKGSLYKQLHDAQIGSIRPKSPRKPDAVAAAA